MTAPNTLAELPALQAILQRPLTDDQDQRALELLMQASALFRVQVPWVDDRIADGTLSAVVVASAVAGIVKRVITNPNGDVAITTGPYSVTKQTRDGGGNDGDLAVLASDIAKITQQGQRQVGSIKLKPALAPAYGLDRSGRLVEAGLVGYPSGACDPRSAVVQ